MFGATLCGGQDQGHPLQEFWCFSEAQRGVKTLSYGTATRTSWPISVAGGAARHSGPAAARLPWPGGQPRNLFIFGLILNYSKITPTFTCCSEEAFLATA